MKKENDLKLTTKADLFYHSQATPADYDEMMLLIANFAGQFAEMLLKEAAQKARKALLNATLSVSESDNLHDDIISLIDQYKG